MKTFAAFQPRSLGTLPRGARRTITAAATLVTAFGGLGKAFSSVRLTWGKAQAPLRPGGLGKRRELSSWSSAASDLSFPHQPRLGRNSTLRPQEVQFSLRTSPAPDALETSLSFLPSKKKWFIWYSGPTEPCSMSQDIS